VTRAGRGAARFGSALLVTACTALLAGGGGRAHAQWDEFYEGLFERETLTGDWGGLRTTLAERGVEIGLTNYGDLMGVARGGHRRRTVYSHLLEPTVAIDLDKLIGWPQARLFYRGIGTYGNDPADATGSIHAPSNLASIRTFTVFEGWIEQRFFDDVLAILIGLYAADTEFDVKETAGVFMNGGFGTGLDLSETGLNGPCIFPTSCFGVRFRLQPTPEFYLQSAVLDGVAGDPDHPGGTKVKLRSEDGVLVLNEVGYQQGAEEGRFFRAAVGGWVYTMRFDDVRDVDSAGNPVRRRGTYGFYALVESELYREAGQRTQGLSGFLRAGMADQNVNQIRYYVGGGLAYTGLLPEREEDVVGFGVSAGFNGGKFKRAQRLAGAPVDDMEMALEWTYQLKLLPRLTLQLDAQFIKNPGTDRTLKDALVFGFRYGITF
jgi:porin